MSKKSTQSKNNKQASQVVQEAEQVFIDQIADLLIRQAEKDCD